LILKKSDKAVHVVLRLSELLRYVLYESEHPKIALCKEIEFIKSYIELEQMRLGSSAKIELEVQGDVNTQYIAPLIIMPFVENSIKHSSVLPRRENAISIRLNVDANLFQLHLKNPTMSEGALSTTNEGGIGLRNVSKRLELLYPGKHHLSIKNEGDWFEVNLNIELS
jgi:LytS/YehU family sensor histidine kinase